MRVVRDILTTLFYFVNNTCILDGDGLRWIGIDRVGMVLSTCKMLTVWGYYSIILCMVLIYSREMRDKYGVI